MNICRFILSKYKTRIYIKNMQKLKVDIDKKAKIHNRDKIKFGKYVYIGPDCEFMAAGGITIGNNVIFGPKVSIWTENHNFKSTKLIPYDAELLHKEVVIGDNVWCGYNAQIAPGTVIGEGSVIGMGAVVRGVIPPCSIVIGNPAKVISTRDVDVYEKIKQEEGFYYKHKKEHSLDTFM